MRVLHVIPSLDPASGGPARSVPALCEALSTAGADVTLHAIGGPGRPTTVRIGGERFPIRIFPSLPGTRQVPTPAFYRAITAGPRFDLVHINSMWNAAVSVAALACRRAGIPYVVSPRGMLQRVSLSRRQLPKRLVYALLERRTVSGARAFHFLTEAEARDSDGLTGDKPFFILSSGIDPGIRQSTQKGRFRRGNPRLIGKKIMLFMGRLHWSKGLDVQLEALGILARDHPDLVWVLVGPDGGEWPSLVQRAEQLGLKDRIISTGFLGGDERLEALADADVFVLTSRHEAHSMAMNESLALGIPLVISESVQFDLVKSRGAGLVVSNDAAAVARAVARVVTDREIAAGLREAGFRLVDETLSWPRIAQTMLLQYNNLLATPSLENHTVKQRHTT